MVTCATIFMLKIWEAYCLLKTSVTVVLLLYDNSILDSFSDLCHLKGFTILSLPKFHQLIMELEDTHLDVICLNETWLKASVTSNLVTIRDYTLFRQGRCNSETAHPRHNSALVMTSSKF